MTYSKVSCIFEVLINLKIYIMPHQNVSQSEPTSFVLFEGRHEIPGNPSPIYSGFDFDQFSGIYGSGYSALYSALTRGESVRIYVTGLTPALTELMFMFSDYLGQITLLHFNRETGTYIEQSRK